MLSIRHTLTADIIGEIWMPQTVCTKECVSVTSSREKGFPDDFRYSDGSRPTLREMALRLLDDGDFRSCRFQADAVMLTSTYYKGNKRITATRFLSPETNPTIADLFQEC